MKDCRNRKEKLIDLLENQLSGEDRNELLEHLKHCPHCAREYSKLQKLRRVMDSDRVEYPPEDTFERMKSLARQRVLQPRRRLLGRLFKALVPAFALAVLLLFILRSRAETVNISIPVAHLLEDEEIAEIAIAGIVSNDLVTEIEVLEEQLSFDADEAIEELSMQQRSELVNSLRRKYAAGT
ncbi:MAG: zf-HC2 domain-containing protein [candidate division WOR-3 bacterium]|jgi:anti-sigma factor RsiW